MRATAKRSLGLVLASLFVISLLPTPVAANPVVPYCGAASVGGATSATAPALVLPEVCEQLTGRVFPEALADPDYLGATGPNGFTGGSTGFATDYVGYFEFQRGLEYLEANYPDWIEVHEVALSRGMTNLAGGPDRNPIYILEISNEMSPIPRDEKQNLLFMLSIHGNEKGGREGGFRVLEDLVKNIGFATETVQQGAGIPGGLEKPTGGQVNTYRDMLDFANVFLLFPNVDGWACDEIEYGAGGLPIGSTGTDFGGCPGLFTRGNSAGTDLNRQTPTIGWHNPNRNVMGEPESGAPDDADYPGFGNWLVDQRDDSNGVFQWDYAIDIHGMINHQNFGAIMLPAGSFSPQEMYRSTRLAETLKERWNADPHFDEWRTLFQTLETGWAVGAPAGNTAYAALCGQVDCPAGGSFLDPNNPPSSAAGSSQFAEYYTVIDAIGYTDSGFNGDFFAQTTGLNAPGYDIELAYNHLNCSAQYECGAFFNDYHVHMVRHIVKSFLDAAALDVKISYETNGVRTAYVPTDYVATNLDDVDADGNPMLTPGGWADQNPGDDKWDYGPDQPFQARPAKYWEDIAPFLCENCGTTQAIPGQLDPRRASTLTSATLANYDNLIIPGTAINQFFSTGVAFENSLPVVETDDGFEPGSVDAAAVARVLEWVENGGNLVLTDAALSFFDMSGLTNNAVGVTPRYMGGIKVDLSHDLLDKVRGGVMQMYEPTPLGFGTTGSAPNWHVQESAIAALGGSVAGRECGLTQLNTPACDGNPVGLGEVPYGAGTIRFMGSILPDPTEEFYHPYGLDHYATTYSGNQIVRNMLDWDEVFAAPPVSISADGRIIQTANEPTVQNVGPGTSDGDDGGAKDTPAPGLLLLLVALGFAALRRRGN